MVVGVLRLELFLPMSASLKDKRSVVQGLKGQLRAKFNVAVAELDSQDKWQRASLGIATVGEDRHYVDGNLTLLVEWVRERRTAELIKVERELL